MHTLSAMLKYSINALCMIEWSTIPFSKIGWITELMCRNTEPFCSPSLEIRSTILTTWKKFKRVELQQVNESHFKNLYIHHLATQNSESKRNQCSNEDNEKVGILKIHKNSYITCQEDSLHNGTK